MTKEIKITRGIARPTPTPAAAPTVLPPSPREGKYMGLHSYKIHVLTETHHAWLATPSYL